MWILGFCQENILVETQESYLVISTFKNPIKLQNEVIIKYLGGYAPRKMNEDRFVKIWNDDK